VGTSGPAGRDAAAGRNLALEAGESGVVHGATVATAESLTAGLIAAALAEVPGSSAVLRGGVVAYHNEVKQLLLGVPAALLARVGSVDPEVARRMALGARERCGADIGISSTGVAGPAPHDGKPVGLVYIGYATAHDSGALRLELAGDRAGIRAASRDAALAQLVRLLAGND
jgi:nicotinamide-nucleotide amidase